MDFIKWVDCDLPLHQFDLRAWFDNLCKLIFLLRAVVPILILSLLLICLIQIVVLIAGWVWGIILFPLLLRLLGPLDQFDRLLLSGLSLLGHFEDGLFPSEFLIIRGRVRKGLRLLYGWVVWIWVILIPIEFHRARIGTFVWILKEIGLLLGSSLTRFHDRLLLSIDLLLLLRINGKYEI